MTRLHVLFYKSIKLYTFCFVLAPNSPGLNGEMTKFKYNSVVNIYKINNLVQQLRSFTIIILLELYERQTRQKKIYI